MNTIKRELTNLTWAQVEALLECFDFLANGYEETSCFEVGDLWVVQMRHKRTQKIMRMFIHPDRYRLLVAGITRKKVSYQPKPDRYQLVVNSDASVGVIRLNASARKISVSGSLSVHMNDRRQTHKMCKH